MLSLLTYAISFACEFKVEAGEANSVSLENTHWKLAVQIEVVFTNSTKLHVYTIVVILVDQLEILHTCLVDTSIEIQNKCLNSCTVNFLCLHSFHLGGLLKKNIILWLPDLNYVPRVSFF